MRRVLGSALLLLLVTGCAGRQPQSNAVSREYDEVLALRGTAKKEVLTIAHLLTRRPEYAIDRTAESGEYCLKSGQGTMVHFATAPERTPEGIVYEFDATGLMQAGLDPAKLPALPKLGGMKPGTWYYLPQGGMDPHHQHEMSKPTVAIAVDVR